MGPRGCIFAIVFAGLVTAPAIVHAGARLAPADEYFGRAKMSPLEITNRIRDAERGRASYAGLMTTQYSIEDWTHKYPDDPWIPSREYRMSHLFARLHSPQGNAEAAHCRSFLRVHFAGSSFAIAAERGAPHAAAKPLPKAPAKTAVAKTPAKKRHRFLGISF